LQITGLPEAGIAEAVWHIAAKIEILLPDYHNSYS
jgi:hypothetical protein